MVDVSDESIELPPGFRFHPTDEEIISHYLSQKVVNSSFTARAIGEADLNKCEPWDLPKRARMGEKEWYFFCQRDRKYPTGMRTNRATEAGYWKATGKDKEIYKGRNCLVGMKKTLVFYRGRAPKGEKTNWVMHEYRLEGKFSYHNLPRTAKDEWVVCRVFHKNSGVKKSPMVSGLLGIDEFIGSPSLPPLMDSSHFLPSSRYMTNNNSNGNQFTYSIDGGNISNHQHDDNKNFIQSNNNYTMVANTNNTTTTTLSPNTNYYSQIPYPNPIFRFQESSNSYFHPGLVTSEQAIIKNLAPTNARQCKVEQFSSNHSMVSQETGLSTDMNTEISSVASKHELRGNRPYEEFEGPSSSSAGPVMDLDCLWNY